MRIEVLDTTDWQVHWGGIENTQGGIDGQLTRCKLHDAGQWSGLVFYVRENMAADHFNTSAGERKGWKEGRLSKSVPQVLELCCPAAGWDLVAAAVKDADGLGRRVRKNRNFSEAWAKGQLARKDAP